MLHKFDYFFNRSGIKAESTRKQRSSIVRTEKSFRHDCTKKPFNQTRERTGQVLYRNSPIKPANARIVVNAMETNVSTRCAIKILSLSTVSGYMAIVNEPRTENGL